MIGLLQGCRNDFKYRQLSNFLVVASVCYVWLTGLVPYNKLWLHAWRPMVWVALVLSLLGLFLRSWATGYLPLEVITDYRVHVNRLVTEGPYRFTRNPLYLGTWFCCLSVGFLLDVRALFVLGSMMMLRIMRLITYEESELSRKLGSAYAAYCARVPRFIPWQLSEVIGCVLARERADWLLGLFGNAFNIQFPIAYAVALLFPRTPTHVVFALIFAPRVLFLLLKLRLLCRYRLGYVTDTGTSGSSVEYDKFN